MPTKKPARKVVFLEDAVPKIRTFDTGATRDQNATKHDFSGYMSPLVVMRFGQYMTSHRVQPDGTVRASNNWKKGIPLDAYMESAWRHFEDLWLEHEGYESREGKEDALCGLLFNIAGYLDVHLKSKGYLKKKATNA